MEQNPELTGTQLKLRSTPTAGLDGEHSPYYRRLLSAGYKGFLQGTIGGSTLYGGLGLAVGALVAAPAFFLVGPAAFAMVPVMGGLGIMKGASTFGNIGSLAAISAESAEMSEKRRYLLDRYHELPDTPEHDAEANKIQEILGRQHIAEKPENMFHWKTVAIGAALGAAVAFGLLTVPGFHVLITPAIEAVGVAMGMSHAAAAASFLPSAIGVGIGTMLGAATGATIGLDRYYVRKWFDFSESVVHDPSTQERNMQARQREVESLGTRSLPSGYAEAQRPVASATQQAAAPIAQAEPMQSINPTLQVSETQHQSRLADIQRAMAVPTV